MEITERYVRSGPPSEPDTRWVDVRDIPWLVAAEMDRQAAALMALSEQHRGGMSKGLVRAAQLIGGQTHKLIDEG